MAAPRPHVRADAPHPLLPCTPLLQATRKRTSAAQLTDRDVAFELATVNPDVFEDPEVREYLDLFARDDLSEETLQAMGSEQVLGELPDSTLADADLARTEAVLNQQVRCGSGGGRMHAACACSIAALLLTSHVSHDALNKDRSSFKASCETWLGRVRSSRCAAAGAAAGNGAACSLRVLPLRAALQPARSFSCPIMFRIASCSLFS